MTDWDYYELLGVARHATVADIHRGYRQKAKVYHPDRYPLESPERESAERWFKQLGLAHDTLSDPDLRAAYDADLAAKERAKWAPQVFDFPLRTPPPARQPKEFEDFLEEQRREAEREEAQDESAAQPAVESPAVRGTSEATRKSAAKAYYAQGLRYAGYGDTERALSLIQLARQLDPSLKVSPWLLAKMQRSRY